MTYSVQVQSQAYGYGRERVELYFAYRPGAGKAFVDYFTVFFCQPNQTEHFVFVRMLMFILLVLMLMLMLMLILMLVLKC